MSPLCSMFLNALDSALVFVVWLFMLRSSVEVV